MALTLDQLFKQTSRLRDKVNDTSSFGITKIAPAPNLFGNTIAVEAKFNAHYDTTRAYYLTLIVFHNLSWTQTKDVEHPLKMEIIPGEYIYSSKPSLNKSAVGVRCLCKDYYYTWWYFNKNKGALAGNDLPRYTRRDGSSPGSGKKARNKVKAPGLCKHLIVLAEYLSEKGWLST